jgi:F0F1-type ATP synthase assembly protein I
MPSDSENQKKDEDSNRVRQVRALGLLTLVIADLLAYTGAGLALGWLLWKKLHLGIFSLLLPTAAGLGVAFFQIYRKSERLSQD